MDSSHSRTSRTTVIPYDETRLSLNEQSVIFLRK